MPGTDPTATDLTPEQRLELAARRLCRARGFDPDATVHLGYVTAPLWRSYAEVIRMHRETNEAAEEAFG
jgi:hypothetical protein